MNEDFIKRVTAATVAFTPVSKDAVGWSEGRKGYFRQFYKAGAYRFKPKSQGLEDFTKRIEGAGFTVREE
jgi:hypothetical protein